jgi:hypothetical protein
MRAALFKAPHSIEVGSGRWLSSRGRRSPSGRRLARSGARLLLRAGLALTLPRTALTLVFILAGGLFAPTAKTCAKGASMFPEAGGSSSFGRPARSGILMLRSLLASSR